MEKRSYTHVQELLPRIQAMVAEGKSHVIYLHRKDYPILAMCQFFEVSRS